MRIFSERGVSAQGKVLSREDTVLMLDKGGIPPFCDEKMADIVKDAEALLDTPLEVMPLYNYRQFQEAGSVNSFGAYFSRRLNRMATLGYAEAYERAGRFTEKLCDYIWATLEEASWVLPEHTACLPSHPEQTCVPPAVGKKYQHGLELGAIYKGATLAMIYRLLKDEINAVSPIIGKRIEYTLKDRIIKPYLESHFWWSGESGRKVNNWCPWNVSNILLVTAIIEEDPFRREQVVSKALAHLDNFISFYPEDGGCDEGPTYWNAAAGSLFDCLEILYDISGGKIDVYDHPMLKAMGEYLPTLNIAGKRFANFGDASDTINANANMVQRFGEKCGSLTLACFGDILTAYTKNGVDKAHPYRCLRTLTTPVCDVAGRRIISATDAYLANLKIMVLRESDNPFIGKFFAFKGGNNGESHNHNDVGSFVLYKNAKPVLIDAGVGTYTRQTFSKDRYKIWSMQSLYHNLASFDGVGELQGKPYGSANEVYDKDGRRLTMDIQGAFPEVDGLKLYRRSGSLIGDTVTVTDTVELEREMEIDFVFITNAPTECVGNTVLLPEGCVMEFDPALDYELEKFTAEGMSPSAWGTPDLYRTHLKIRSTGGVVKFTVK